MTCPAFLYFLETFRVFFRSGNEIDLYADSFVSVLLSLTSASSVSPIIVVIWRLLLSLSPERCVARVTIAR